MLSIGSGVLPLLLAVALPAADTHTHNALTDAEKAGGWTLLFDGRSTDGWTEITGDRFPPTWRVEDGCLRTILNADSFQDLRSKGTWSDFEFAWEWKIAVGGNSGVKYLVQRVDKWASRTGAGYHARARGFEYQLVDDAANEDARKDPSHVTGALYSYLVPTAPVLKPAGEFNESRIVVRGDHVEHWLNGVRVVEFEAHSPALIEKIRSKNRNDAAQLESMKTRETPVVLQHHDSEVWFRCLRIRDLSRGNQK